MNTEERNLNVRLMYLFKCFTDFHKTNVVALYFKEIECFKKFQRQKMKNPVILDYYATMKYKSIQNECAELDFVIN